MVDGRGDEFDRQALGVKQPVGPSHVQPRMIGVGGPIEGDLDVLVGRHGIFRTSYACTNTATQKKNVEGDDGGEPGGGGLEVILWLGLTNDNILYIKTRLKINMMYINQCDSKNICLM